MAMSLQLPKMVIKFLFKNAQKVNHIYSILSKGFFREKFHDEANLTGTIWWNRLRK